jgi:thiol-disulfide isomerase/thioredoxin|tara:strand:- start:243 stop:764 length:522 start_codon:yes stop_codon:yes gene_type:complete
MKFLHFVLFVVLIISASSDLTNASPSRLISHNKAINLDYELIELDGFNNDQTYKLGSLDGLVIINFWSSWCNPCIKEIVELNKFQKRIDEERLDVKIIGINIFDDIKDASRFKIKYKPTFQTLFDKHKTIPIDFGVVGVPETYFVKNNTIFFKYIGKITEEVLDQGYKRTKNE